MILRVKIQRAGRQGCRVCAVVDVVIKRSDGAFALIGYSDARMLLEGHREKTIQIFYAAYRKHFRLPRIVVTQAKSKEVADRRLYTRRLLAIPVNAQHNSLQVIRFG